MTPRAVVALKTRWAAETRASSVKTRSGPEALARAIGKP